MAGPADVPVDGVGARRVDRSGETDAGAETAPVGFLVAWWPPEQEITAPKAAAAIMSIAGKNVVIGCGHGARSDEPSTTRGMSRLVDPWQDNLDVSSAISCRVS